MNTDSAQSPMRGETSVTIVPLRSRILAINVSMDVNRDVKQACMELIYRMVRLGRYNC